jgi:integrase/recombinase XerD
MGRPKRSPLPPAPVGTLLYYVRPFLTSLQVRNFSEMTLKPREHYLRAFAAWVEERGVTQASEVTRAVLERYQGFLTRYRKKSGESLSFRSQHIQLTALRLFFKWLAKERHIEHNPASEMELPRLGRRLPKAAMTIEETETVLALPDLTNPLGLRDRAILEVLYSTGIRRSELAHLTLPDLDFGRGIVFINQGKGKKDRFVPIGQRAIAWVVKYLEEARPRLVVGETLALFLNVDGKPLDPLYLTERIRDYLARSGIQKKGGCHLFRHTTATLMLEGGADIRYIQQMLGHADLSSTQVYTHVAIQQLKAVHELTHPAKMKREDPPPPPAGAAGALAPQPLAFGALPRIRPSR